MSISCHIRLRALLLEVGLFRLVGGMLLVSAAAIAWQATRGAAPTASIVEPILTEVHSTSATEAGVAPTTAKTDPINAPLTATDLLRSANDKGLREVTVTRAAGAGANNEAIYRVVALGAYENVRTWMALQLNEHASAAITRLALDGVPTEPGTVKVDLELHVIDAGADTSAAK